MSLGMFYSVQDISLAILKPRKKKKNRERGVEREKRREKFIEQGIRSCQRSTISKEIITSILRFSICEILLST